MLFQSGHLSRDLARKSVRGGMTTIGSQGVQFVLRIAGTAVLARLLTPADYGLIGMVMVVVNFATMFKDAGLSMATVQKKDITHEQISTLFWLNILISVVLCLCVLACSPLVAWFYGKPELTTVTVALSFSFILSGLTIQHEALQRRHMRFGTLAGIRIASQVITMIVTIGLALFGWRYWALVGGTLAHAFAGSLLTFLFCPWVPGRMQKGTGVREMLKFGGYLTGFNSINYFARNADNVLIGKFIGAEALGFYSRAYTLFMMPISQIRGPINQVALPVLSSLRNEPERYVKYYQYILDIMATLTFPMMVYCAIEADFLIRLLLGPQWLGAVPVFRILATVGLIQSIATTWGFVVISCGYVKRYFFWGTINAIICVLSFILGIPYGINGVAGFYAIANYIMLFPTLWICFSGTPVSVSLFCKTILAPFCVSILATGCIMLSKYFCESDTLGVHGLHLIIFGISYVIVSWVRPSCRDTFKIFLREFPITFATKTQTG
ncbi:MAG: oligosaccharide flippase family protein [Sedimentisphaerales bacterium]|nr:oligosaccharide flippase family protein [Sedimentisphaerales bacterium]